MGKARQELAALSRLAAVQERRCDDGASGVRDRHEVVGQCFGDQDAVEQRSAGTAGIRGDQQCREAERDQLRPARFDRFEPLGRRLRIDHVIDGEARKLRGVRLGQRASGLLDQLLLGV